MYKIILLLIAVALPIPAVADGSDQATFVVACYDVGARALQGRPGIIQVEKGWQQDTAGHYVEVNRVEYDPEQIKLEQLEELLQTARTWLATLPEE